MQNPVSAADRLSFAGGACGGLRHSILRGRKRCLLPAALSRPVRPPACRHSCQPVCVPVLVAGLLLFQPLLPPILGFRTPFRPLVLPVSRLVLRLSARTLLHRRGSPLPLPLVPLSRFLRRLPAGARRVFTAGRTDGTQPGSRHFSHGRHQSTPARCPHPTAP